jgi:hypothetical protein
MEVHVLDNYYLAITLLITIGYQLFFFAIAFSLKFDKLTGMYPAIFGRQLLTEMQISLEEPISLS